MFALVRKLNNQLFRVLQNPVLLVLGGLGFVALLTPLPALAGVQNFFAQIILWIAQFLGKITLTLIGLLVEVVQYNDFINAPAVVKGWVVVRDVVNMFFIVVLLAISFGTMFRMEEYQYKHHLGKLLTMAVLVNFSKSIAGFFIDFAQVVMLTFVNGFKEAAAANFINGFHLDQMFQFAEQGNATQAADESVFLYAALLALITIAITTVVVGVYLIIFLLRIVALWFLIIISPLAFLANAWPGKGHEYHEEWWEYFGKYASTGPILAFFLWLSLAVMQFSESALGDFSIKNSDLSIPAASVTGIGDAETLLSFIISIILLIGGLWMASHLGVVGGNLASGAISGIRRAGVGVAKVPFRLGRTAAGYAGRKYNEKMPAWTNPVALYRGWKHRGDELREESKEIATARGQTAVTRLLTGGRVRTDFEALKRHEIMSKHYKEYASLTKEEKAYQMAGLVRRGGLGGRGGMEGELLRGAFALAAGSESHSDDIYASDYFANEHDWTDANGQRHQGLAMKVDSQGNVLHGNRGALTQDEIEQGVVQVRHNHEILHDYMTSTQTGRYGARVANEIGELMRKVNHPQGMEHATFNERTGRAEWRTLEESAHHGMVEFAKMPERQQLQSHVHASKWQYYDPRLPEGHQFYWGRPKGNETYEALVDARLEHADAQERRRFSTQRLAGAEAGFNHDAEGRAIVTPNILRDTDLEHRYVHNANGTNALFNKGGATSIIYEEYDPAVGEYVERAQYRDINAMAAHLGWVSPRAAATNRINSRPRPLMDIDTGKQQRTHEALEQFNSKPENKGTDFFASQEYARQAAQYYSPEEYYANDGFQRWRQEHGGGYSVNKFSRGQGDEVAVDFTKLDIPGLQGLAGAYLHEADDIKHAARGLTKVLDEEIAKLRAKPAVELTTAEQQKLGYSETARERLQHPEQLGRLVLYNTAREGVGARRLITHERQHAALAQLDPNEVMQRQLWENNHTPDERRRIISDVRQKQSAPEMSEDDVRREYFADGITNETQWGDASATAIKLKPEVRDILIKRLQERGEKGVGYGVVPEQQVGKSSQGESMPDIASQVQVTLDNTFDIHSINTKVGALAGSWFQKREFFRPLLNNLRQSLRHIFDEQDMLSGDVLKLRDNMLGALGGLSKDLSKDVDTGEFDQHLTSFMREFKTGKQPADAATTGSTNK